MSNASGGGALDDAIDLVSSDDDTPSPSSSASSSAASSSSSSSSTAAAAPAGPAWPSNQPLPRLSLPAAAALLRQALGGGDDGDGVMLDATDVSLMDSYTLGRIAVPVRSIECEHFECFDAGTFHSAAMAKCPVCDREAGKNTLYVDTLFEAMARMGPELQLSRSIHFDDSFLQASPCGLLSAR